MQIFLRCFIPLFVAMDIIGNLPVYMALTTDMPQASARKVARLAGLTATVVGLLFLWFGRQMLASLHVSPADFKIAGGAVLFIIAVSGVMHDEPQHKGVLKEQVGVVPIGVPLMVGPATLVTLLLLGDMYPTWAAMLGLISNVALSIVVFHFSKLWAQLIHVNVLRAISKVVHFFLAAIAVMMMRVGLTEIFG